MGTHPELFTNLPVFTLIQASIINPGKLPQSRLTAEKQNIRRAMQQAYDKYSSLSLPQVAASWKGPILPSDLIPWKIYQELTTASTPLTEIKIWHSLESDLELSKTTRAIIADLRTRFPQIVAQHQRFIPISEDENSINLFYVEQPDLSNPQVRELQRYHFYQLASQAIGGDALEKIRVERLKGKFELSIP